MATIKTVEFRCPHCNKKVSSIPSNDYCAIKDKLYGDPRQTCRKCGNTYSHTFLVEPAAELTLAQQVPFWLTGVRTILILAIVAICSFGTALPILIPGYLAACFLTRKQRQEHKDRLLTESRNRMKDPEYFLRFLYAAGCIRNRSKLTSHTLAYFHTKAIRVMDADQSINGSGLTMEIAAFFS